MENSYLILSIDDELMIRHSIVAFLEDYDFEVIEAENGRVGIEKIRSEKPDLILCDLRMPEVDGLDVLKMVQEETPETPIIMVSGTSLMKDVVEALRLGAWDYIMKPISDLGILYIAVEKALEKTNLIKENNAYKNKLEEMLEIRTRQLLFTEKQAAVSQVVQGIVHNMRTPISIPLSIKELTEDSFEKIDNYLKDPVDKQDKIKNQLERIKNFINLNYDAGVKINDMIDSLMIKSSSDKINDLRIVNLNEILRNELNFLEANLAFKNKVLKNINVSSESFLVNVVPSELSQIINNLIKNSMDALYNFPHPTLNIETGKNDQFYWLVIEDNGPGIPEEIQDKIFDPFFTTKPIQKSMESKEPVGTGLGLHFCKNTIESFHGYIDLQSEIGKGCKFTIYLPKVKIK